MFRKKPQQTPFERCAHKTVKETRIDGLLAKVALHCPRTEDDSLSVVAIANEIGTYDPLRKGTGRLTTEQDGEVMRYRDPKTAFTHLGRNACAVVCGGCDYADMSLIDVAKAREQQATERAAAAGYEVARLEALVELQEYEDRIAELQARLKK